MSSTFAHSTTATTPEVSKRIAYNRDTRDYDCLVAIDGGAEQYIGSASTYGQAETTCNTFVYDYYTDANTPEIAVELAMEPATPLEGFYVSPGVGADLTGADVLGYTPKITMVGNDRTIRLGRLSDAEWIASADEQINNPRRPIREVSRLARRGLVIIDTAEELFVMTESEYDRAA
jgi:hypothetical protein